MKKKAIKQQQEQSPHLEFATKAQLLRFFHERTLAELQAMKKMFDTTRGGKKP